MHPTLLVGPADWDAARMPRDEFLERTTALWRRCPSAGGAIVYGGRAQHAELAYLTHFTPKLEAALALIPRVGTPRLLVGGGVNMLPAAKPLTWIEDIRPLRGAGKTVAEWTREQAGGGRPVLIGGPSMPYPLRQEIGDALGAPIEDRTSALRALMRRKSARELAAIREACATLAAAVRAIADAQGAGMGATAAILAGERAANDRSAQDVRTLFGRDGSLRPFDTPVEHAIDPLQVYVAIRQSGYWAEGFAVLAASPAPGAAQAGQILRAVIPMAQGGRRCREVAVAIAEAVGPMRSHPVTRQIYGNSIGLALEEHPFVTAEGEDTFEPGGVYGLRVGVSGERGDCAIGSAMIAVHEHGNEVLWSSLEAPK